MALALFDLDNTLLGGDSDHAWGEFLCQKGIVDTEAYRSANDHFYAAYQAGTLDIRAYLAFALTPLIGEAPDTLAAWHQDFMRDYIAPMRLAKADALLDKHRQQGDTLLIITATNRFVTGPIAQWLGVENLLATEPAMEHGRYTGAVDGVPCFREGKVTRLNAWLADHQQTLDGSWFYSDSHNDLPLLEAVTHPVAVDADAELTRIATDRGWPRLSLR
ncbi:MAG TPA: HAD family hydrolase [Pseudomonadales bacterium]